MHELKTKLRRRACPASPPRERRECSRRASRAPSRPKRSEQIAGRARAPQTEPRQLSRLMISAWLTIHTTSLKIHNLIIGYLDTTSVCGLCADSKLHPVFYDILKTHEQMTLSSDLVPLQTTQDP